MASENVREVCMNAVLAFKESHGEESDRQRLLEILRNPDYRDVLATCVNEAVVITAFHWATDKNDVDLLQALHDVGVDVDSKIKAGNTPLIIACWKGKNVSAHWLLDHGANVNARNDYGSTALAYAACNRKLDIVEMLLQKNANVDFQDKRGETALMFASANGHTEMVQLLLNYNPDIDLKNKDGETALDLSYNNEIEEMIANHVNTSYVLK